MKPQALWTVPSQQAIRVQSPQKRIEGFGMRLTLALAMAALP